MSEAVLDRPVSSRRTPVHLWIVGVVALLWNSIGAWDYTATQLQYEPYMSAFTEKQLAYFYGFPAWVVAFWAFGVWGAMAGSVGLLLRKRWAVWAFGLSLVGLAVTTVYNYVLTDGLEIMAETMGTGVAMGMNVLIWGIAIVLFLYARAQAAKGVLT
jgi:hypothetical protein